MRITQVKLTEAVAEKIISYEQAKSLFEFFNSNIDEVPRFNFTHILYYFGGLIAIGAMSIFMTLGWDSFGGKGIVLISIAYAILGLKIANIFAVKKLVIPAGICATFVVCITPLAIFGIQQWLGIWNDDTHYRDYHRYIRWHWLYMELGTLAVGIILAWWYKYPFLTMPIAVTLWYMTMDIAGFIVADTYLSWELRTMLSLYFGLLMIFIAFLVDLRARNKADYAFWIYIFGVISFWGGLSFQESDLELSKFIYFCINLLMIGIGVLLVRRVFVVFGAFGAFGYIGHLAFDLFEDSWLFPIALTLIGLGVIYLGVLWQKYEKKITQKTRSILPTQLRELLECRAYK